MVFKEKQSPSHKLAGGLAVHGAGETDIHKAAGSDLAVSGEPDQMCIRDRSNPSASRAS